MAKLSYSTRLDEELLNWLVKYARSSGLSQQSIVEEALIAYRARVNRKKSNG